ARDPARLAPAGQSGRAANLRGRDRTRSHPPRVRRLPAPDRRRRPGVLPVLRQALLPRLLPRSVSALQTQDRGPRATGLIGPPRRNAQKHESVRYASLLHVYASGAPRSMKMGTIRSPWRYDAAISPTQFPEDVRPAWRQSYDSSAVISNM